MVPVKVEINARYDALEWASQQFAKAFVDVAGVARSVTAACNLAASSTGEDGGSAALASAGTRVTGVLDAAGSQLLDIAGGLRAAVFTYQSADQSAAGADPPARPGRAS
jgi:hypothetical protein